MLVAWDITSKCNLSCIHCYNSRAYEDPFSEKLGPDLSTKEVFSILDKLADGEVDAIQFLGGEPFVRHDFIDILRYAKNKNISCNIATNGVLVNQTIIKKLVVVSPKQIAFSIDGATAKNNDVVRGKGVFDRAVNNLKLLSGYFKANNIKTDLGIQCTLNKFNKQEIGRIVSLGKELDLDFVAFESLKILTQYDVIQKNELKKIILNFPELFKAGEEIASLMSLNQTKIRIAILNWGTPKFRNFLNHKYKVSLRVGKSCRATSELFYIRADGIVHPCNYCSDFDENNLPQTVKKEKLDFKVLSFDQVVDSEYFRTFFYFAHNGELYEKIEYCRKCEFYEICEPCPLDIMRFENRVASECATFEKYLKEINRTV
jgi:radical SAM protein with 4Fe4S-binding SPASM domain